MTEPINLVAATLATAAAARVRDHRQVNLREWAEAAFGVVEASSVAQRGVRLLEEAIEAAQASGVTEAMAHELVSYVFARPVGELGQELGGVGVTLLLLAHAAGLSADGEEAKEMLRVLMKDPADFAKRNAAKNAAGFLAVPEVKQP